MSWDFLSFTEFCRYEKASGGPDPQIPLVGEMSSDQQPIEKLWRAGVYVSVYNVPCAEFLWRKWPWERVNAESEKLHEWLLWNWRLIVTRQERRCVRTPAALAKFLWDYRDWVLGGIRPADYETLWAQALLVKFMGRYAALKLLRCLHVFGGIPNSPPDIRPRGGWSPIKALRQIRPEGDLQEAFSSLQSDLASENIDVDLFELQTLLCEYRESYEELRQYPGRSLDSELGYYVRNAGKWGPTEMFTARAVLFPPAHLGEFQGWEGPRKALGRVLHDYGYVWSDLKYDYTATADFAQPAAR